MTRPRPDVQPEFPPAASPLHAGHRLNRSGTPRRHGLRAAAAMLLVAVLVAQGAAPAWAEHGDEPGALGRLLSTIGEKVSALRETYAEWRRSPLERMAEENRERQAQLRGQLDVLQAQLDALRSDLNSVQTTPGPEGPEGPVGPSGPVGPRGPMGLPGNLQLAGEACPAGQAVTGFDAFGNVLCGNASGAASGGVGVDCPGGLVSAADLRRCDLRGQRLSGRDLSFATLVKADLRGTIQDTDLQGADLRNAELTGADLANVNLAFANLTLARLGSVQVEGADFSGAVLRNAELSLSRISDVRMPGADLSGASLIMSQHYRSDYTRADLSGADLRQAVFQDSSLFLATTSTSLDQARLINTICPDGVNSSTNGDSCAGHALR